MAAVNPYLRYDWVDWLIDNIQGDLFSKAGSFFILTKCRLCS